MNLRKKKEISKSPIDLSKNFKLVKAPKKNKNKLLSVTVFFFLCLSVLFSSMFFMAQTNVGSDIKYNSDINVENQLPPDFRDDDPQLIDVNQIVLQKKRSEGRTLSEKDFINTKPVEVHVNYPPKASVKAEYVNKVTYKVNKQNLSDFFASAKTKKMIENQYGQADYGISHEMGITPEVSTPIEHPVSDIEPPLSEPGAPPSI